MAKEVGLRIRVDEALRRSFIGACKAQDKTAAQVLRAFMRSFVEHHDDAEQGQLFDAGSLSSARKNQPSRGLP